MEAGGDPGPTTWLLVVQNVPIAVTALETLKPPSAAGRQDGEGKGGGADGVATEGDIGVVLDPVDVMEPIMNKPFALSSLLHSRSSAVASFIRSLLSRVAAPP